MAAPRGNIRFCSIGRYSDKVVVSTYAHFTASISASKYQAVCNKVLGSDRVAEYSRLTITDKEVGTVHYDSDPDCIYLVITSNEYPQRTVFKFLDEVKREFSGQHKLGLSTATENSLSKNVRRWLVGLCSKYDNLEAIDKVRGVQAQVDEVKVVMQDNVQKMLENHEKLEDLDDKANQMVNEASHFKKQSTQLKNRMWWQNCKLWVILIIIVIVVLAIIVGAICGSGICKN
eukprot:CAMPEP_0114558016 /NCGR_PEP_ID=MMETSP0114-20121206/10145_1 /TAXON_ID=31324 /ORGANISM="Goniomonas sp, Strain m" /LENGTH=230 /DNA_ID=CAMNT_0001743355 /DNA_START=16 /DNA_END=708 /DNA_ORIENTATION=+